MRVSRTRQVVMTGRKEIVFAYGVASMEQQIANCPGWTDKSNYYDHCIVAGLRGKERKRR